MKDLLKICRRNILTAVLTVCLVLAVNIIFFFIYILRENQHKTTCPCWSMSMAKAQCRSIRSEASPESRYPPFPSAVREAESSSTRQL